MLDSKKILMEHPVNKKRISEGKNPGNMLWLWGQGRRMEIPAFKDKYGKSGAVISAVDLVNGIGMAMGLDVIKKLEKAGFTKKEIVIHLINEPLLK